MPRPSRLARRSSASSRQPGCSWQRDSAGQPTAGQHCLCPCVPHCLSELAAVLVPVWGTPAAVFDVECVDKDALAFCIRTQLAQGVLAVSLRMRWVFLSSSGGSAVMASPAHVLSCTCVGCCSVLCSVFSLYVCCAAMYPTVSFAYVCAVSGL